MSENPETANNGIHGGSPVVIYLHTPREKLWGLVSDISAAGIFLRGIDLNTFDDWTQMLVKGERNIGLNHVFFPMWRVERVTLDERIDDIPSLADRFQERVGLTIEEYFSK
jgi:hypothetical protein